MANVPRLGRSSNRQRYVVGFAFNADLTRVILMEKNRGPENAEMVGTLNGLGGGMRGRETRLDAMTREFLEEAGLLHREWKLIAICEGADYQLNVMATDLLPGQWRRIRTGPASRTDEQLVRCDARRLPDKVYRDLHWLVPFCAAALLGETPAKITRFDYRGF